MSILRDIKNWLFGRSQEALLLDQIRIWLKSDCTIRATDITEPVLERQPDGSWIGGMTITPTQSQQDTEQMARDWEKAATAMETVVPHARLDPAIARGADTLRSCAAQLRVGTLPAQQEKEQP